MTDHSIESAGDSPPRDLAGHAHWESFYRVTDTEARSQGVATCLWQPRTYEQRALAHWLLEAVVRAEAKTVLEVGCGDSTWLGYLARHAHLERVTGIDYISEGCDRARRRLHDEGVSGEIVCADLFTIDPVTIGAFDFVFSIGFVEHFAQLEPVLERLISLVRPGGVLVTEIPNLRSLHGLVCRLWQPDLFAKHLALDADDLAAASRNLGLEDVRSWYAGVFSMDIVAWESYPRWPRLARWLTPWIRRTQRLLDLALLSRVKWYGGGRLLAPFVLASGRRPSSPS